MVQGVPGAPGGAVELVLPLEWFAKSGLGGSPGRSRVPEGCFDGAPGRSGASPGALFQRLEAPLAPCRRSAEAFSGLKIVLEEVCGLADMKRVNFKVRLSVNVLNLRRPLSIVIRSTSLFGVGGSGRSPVSPPTPWVQRGGRLVEGLLDEKSLG